MINILKGYSEYKLKDSITMKAEIFKTTTGFGAYVECVKKFEVVFESNTLWRLGSLSLQELENTLNNFETLKQVKDSLDI